MTKSLQSSGLEDASMHRFFMASEVRRTFIRLVTVVTLEQTHVRVNSDMSLEITLQLEILAAYCAVELPLLRVDGDAVVFESCERVERCAALVTGETALFSVQGKMSRHVGPTVGRVITESALVTAQSTVYFAHVFV
jgi:carbamoylphosphate synthase large subunit